MLKAQFISAAAPTELNPAHVETLMLTIDFFLIENRVLLTVNNLRFNINLSIQTSQPI